jgi:hypothetical protein
MGKPWANKGSPMGTGFIHLILTVTLKNIFLMIR